MEKRARTPYLEERPIHDGCHHRLARYLTLDPRTKVEFCHMTEDIGVPARNALNFDQNEFTYPEC